MAFSKIVGPIAVIVTMVITIMLWRNMGILGATLPFGFFILAVMTSTPKRLLVLFWIVTLFVPTAEIVLPAMYVKFIEQTFGLYLLAMLLGDTIINRTPISIPSTTCVAHEGTRLLVPRILTRQTKHDVEGS